MKSQWRKLYFIKIIFLFIGLVIFSSLFIYFGVPLLVTIFMGVINFEIKPMLWNQELFQPIYNWINVQGSLLYFRAIPLGFLIGLLLGLTIYFFNTFIATIFFIKIDQENWIILLTILLATIVLFGLLMFMPKSYWLVVDNWKPSIFISILSAIFLFFLGSIICLIAILLIIGFSFQIIILSWVERLVQKARQKQKEKFDAQPERIAAKITYNKFLEKQLADAYQVIDSLLMRPIQK